MRNKKLITVFVLLIIFCGTIVNVYGNNGIGLHYHNLDLCIANSIEGAKNKAKNEFGCDDCTVSEVRNGRYI